MNQRNYNSINESFKAEIERLFEREKRVIMCEFDIIQGAENITQGYTTDGDDSYKSASFKKLFDGQQPILVIWTNSTFAVPDLDEEGKPVLPVKKEFKIGTFYEVISDRPTFTQSFSHDKTKNLIFSTDSSITIKFKGEFKREQFYKFYLFPEYGDEFYFIDYVNYFIDDLGVIIHSELTLKKVNDELENIATHQDILIMRSTPGENYAWPLLVDKLYDLDKSDEEQYKKDLLVRNDLLYSIENANSDEEKIDLENTFIENNINPLVKDVILDEDKLQSSRGIKSIQITSTEPMLLGSVYAIGRPVNSDEIEEPRHLLASKFLPPTVDKILGLNSPSDKFYYMKDSKIMLGKEYKNWWKNFKANVVGENLQIKNYGVIKDSNPEETVLTAPNKKDAADNDVPQSIWDDWIIKNDGAQMNYTTFSPYANGDIVVEEGATFEAHNLLSLNTFLFSHIIKLPVEFDVRVPYSLFNLTIGAFRKLFLGMDAGLFTTTGKRASFTKLPLFGEYSYLTMIYDGFTNTDSSKSGFIPLSAYSNKREKSLYGNNQSSTTIKIELSDEVFIDGKTKINTVDLGKEDKNRYNTKTIVATTNTGYYIDDIVIQAITQSDFKITLFDVANQPIKSLTIQSNNKKTQSFTDWTTIIKLSQWVSDKTFPDSTPIVPPEKLGTFQVDDINDVEEAFVNNESGNHDEEGFITYDIYNAAHNYDETVTKENLGNDGWQLTIEGSYGIRASGTHLTNRCHIDKTFNINQTFEIPNLEILQNKYYLPEIEIIINSDWNTEQCLVSGADPQRKYIFSIGFYDYDQSTGLVKIFIKKKVYKYKRVGNKWIQDDWTVVICDDDINTCPEKDTVKKLTDINFTKVYIRKKI